MKQSIKTENLVDNIEAVNDIFQHMKDVYGSGMEPIDSSKFTLALRTLLANLKKLNLSELKSDKQLKQDALFGLYRKPTKMQRARQHETD